ncbi:hypothetical protein CPB85DRAFT_1445217 [Mucidula mucida]|nr:hypothetical protein CPB85DRAFT_1445217 [Mucidula mucida]
MAEMNASSAFISTSANNDVGINSLERDVQDQVPNHFPSVATNGRTASPDGSPMKVDNTSLPDASPVVDEELPAHDDSTSESRLFNTARLEDRSSAEIDTNLVFTQVCGALLPALLDKGGIPFLRRIRPALKKIATGEFQYPTWMPEDAENMPADVREHFTALKIPRLRGSTTPCLLLHDLGSSSDQEVGKLAKMLSTFVDIVHHKCFVNCSGSGKTRLCLESLCLKYGLYFTCATPELASDGDDDLGGLRPQIGSRDLSSVADTLINDKSFTQNLRDASVQDPIAAGKLNSKIAAPYFVRVLVTRLIIFLEYLGCLSKDQLHSMNAKRAWMYLQAQPFLDDDIPDVFASFARHVVPQHYDKTVDPVSVICKQIVGAGTLGDAFLSSASIRHEVTELQTRPILREIVWSFATIDIKVADQNDFHEEIQHHSAPRNYEPHVIITGSGLSREVASTAYVGVGTPKVMETVTDTGAFAIQEKQQRYLRKYFPSAWLDHEDGEILQYRAWIWLRGRFTASFIEYTLRNWQHAALHGNVLLNIFVAGLSGNFEPWDAVRYPMNLDGVSKPKDWDILAQLNKLPPSFKVGIRKEMCDYFIRNQRPAAIYDATEEDIQSASR